jgi:hypothetical protein
MPVWQNARAAITYDANVVKILRSPENPKMNQLRHNLTIRARLFGYELRWQCGQTVKTLRCQFGNFYDAK